MRGLWFCCSVIVGWLAACREAPLTLPADDEQSAPSDGGEASVETGSRDDAASRAAGAAGESAAMTSDADCSAEAVTLDEIHSGRVQSKVRVEVEPLVASSQKFLVSEAKSGSCLWGAMAAHPARVGKGSGLFLVSFGEPHAEGEACRSGSDGLPDDLAPGDRITARGHVDEFVPSGCAQTAPAVQLRIDASCGVQRDSRGEPPAAAPLDWATATAIAAGSDAALLREWSGALVQLENVTAERDAEDGDAVLAFGVIRLAETPLEVHSHLYYFDLGAGGPRDASKAPRFAYPLTLSRVTGHVLLDYCTWSLAPRSPCSDLEPASQSCASRP